MCRARIGRAWRLFERLGLALLRLGWIARHRLRLLDLRLLGLRPLGSRVLVLQVLDFLYLVLFLGLFLGLFLSLIAADQPCRLWFARSAVRRHSKGTGCGWFGLCAQGFC